MDFDLWGQLSMATTQCLDLNELYEVKSLFTIPDISWTDSYSFDKQFFLNRRIFYKRSKV